MPEAARRARTELDCFRLFFTRAVVDNLVKQTNLYAQQAGAGESSLGWTPVRRDDILAHDAIVTNLKRLRWRLGDGICPRTGCTRWESVPHVFWQCGFVPLLWEWFQVLAERLTFCNTWAVSQDYALYGLSPPSCNTSVRGILTFVSASIKLASLTRNPDMGLISGPDKQIGQI
ncbi:hypothetical protein HOLleu_00805 [Holothuria leucospilota]|uniref:Reverse transcriptase zinc-binding domain-containing protein n=1 Tax=Holothuria leucospilota TaxID=206669 RepID=A0A9Q1CNH2_HOLLE|nr:hypothetical protein HOLleu_00805 [Holothuria leucospilota]